MTSALSAARFGRLARCQVTPPSEVDPSAYRQLPGLSSAVQSTYHTHACVASTGYTCFPVMSTPGSAAVRSIGRMGSGVADAGGRLSCTTGGGNGEGWPSPLSPPRSEERRVGKDGGS